MNLDMMRYYSRRLAGLKWDDIPQRLRLRRLHRHQQRCLKGTSQDNSPGRFFPGEQSSFQKLKTVSGARALEPSILEGWIGDDAFWAEFIKEYPSETERVLSRADAIRSYRFRLFGWKEIQISPPIVWSDALDPDHPGEQWPRDHYAAIDFSHHPRSAQLDIKWCWELNRFQHLLQLGAAWRITKDEGYALTARGHIESWIDQIEYPVGVQWSSNLEVALRMLSWGRCHLMCAASVSWDDEFLLKFLPCLYIHACHVEREFTVHHTAGNHLLGEACSLMQIVCLYKEFPRARRRLERSKKIIERLLPQLILTDGIYAEQSTGYLKFVLEFMVSTLPLMHAIGLEFSNEVMNRIAAAVHGIECLAPDLRHVPMLGDCDSGSGLGWGLSDYWDYGPLARACFALVPESRPSCVDHEFPAEAFLIAGSKGLKDYRAMVKRARSQNAPPSSVQFDEFPEGGYQVSADSRLHLIFDGGSLGISPGYGHGHADGLAFILRIDGLPFLVDPGAMLYNGSPSWRNYFRGISAHNTVRVDKRDPTRPLATFLWSNPVDTSLETSRSGEGWRLLAGTQKTYSGIHKRSILHWHRRGVIVGDIVKGQGVHTVEWFLHFHPSLLVVQEDDYRFLAYGKAATMNIDFYGFQGAVFQMCAGSLEPMAGWYSAAYGKLEPSYSLRIQARAALPVKTVFGVHFPDRFLRIPPELAESFPAWENIPL